MTMIRKLIHAEFRELGDDEVEVVMSTAALARDGHVLVPQGCRLDNYTANPIVLWSHDPEHPIANAEDVTIEPDRIRCRVRFAPLGISRKADEIRGLTKAAIIRAVSVSFDPIAGEPLDPRKPKGGQRFTEWELLELSFVSVPSDTGAVVTNRANGDEPMTEPAEDTPAPKRQRAKAQRGRAKTRDQKITIQRGLYQVAQLCYMLEELGWQVDMAKWEAMVEGDGSAVPSMLAAVLNDFADALLAMTEEELSELVSAREADIGEDEDAVLVLDERQHIAAATSPAIRAFRSGMAHAKMRAGKSLSSETVRCLREAREMHDEAMGLHRSAIRKHKDALGSIDDMMERAGVSDPDNTDTQTVQTSDGVDVEEGSRAAPTPPAAPEAGNADYLRRQADLQAFATTH